MIQVQLREYTTNLSHCVIKHTMPADATRKRVYKVENPRKDLSIAERGTFHISINIHRYKKNCLVFDN